MGKMGRIIKVPCKKNRNKAYRVQTIQSPSPLAFQKSTFLTVGLNRTIAAVNHIILS